MALAALTMPLVVGAMAMALDCGVMYLQRRQAQTAADSAALAGGYALYNGSNFSVARSAAIAVGAQNGFTIPQANVTQPKSTQIAVSVTANPPRFFSGLWGTGSLTIAASAMAQTSSTSSSTTPYSSAAVILLDPSTAGSLTVGNNQGGGSQLITKNGGIQVNSSSSGAVTANSQYNGKIQSPSLNIVGGLATGTPSSAYSGGTLSTGASSTSDPFASWIAPPSMSGYTYTASQPPIPSNNKVTLQPGTYSGGIIYPDTQEAGNTGGGVTITMAPGPYYITGGGFSIGNGNTLVGSGVTIYMGPNGGAINIGGNAYGSATITLSAASSSSNGAIPGVVFYQDSRNTNTVLFEDGSTITITGAIYAPARRST